jgi:hypothetical protein
MDRYLPNTSGPHLRLQTASLNCANTRCHATSCEESKRELYSTPCGIARMVGVTSQNMIRIGLSVNTRADEGRGISRGY